MATDPRCAHEKLLAEGEAEVDRLRERNLTYARDLASLRAKYAALRGQAKTLLDDLRTVQLDIGTSAGCDQLAHLIEEADR